MLLLYWNQWLCSPQLSERASCKQDTRRHPRIWAWDTQNTCMHTPRGFCGSSRRLWSQPFSAAAGWRACAPWNPEESALSISAAYLLRRGVWDTIPPSENMLAEEYVSHTWKLWLHPLTLLTSVHWILNSWTNYSRWLYPYQIEWSVLAEETLITEVVY